MITLIRLLELLLVPSFAVVLLNPPLLGSRICVGLLVCGVALLAVLTVVSTVIAA